MQLPGFLVVDVLCPSSLEHGKQSRAVHLFLHPHLDPASLRELCILSNTGGLHLSTRFPPLAFPKLVEAPFSVLSHGALASWLPNCAGFQSFLLHTYVLLVLFYQWSGFQGEGQQRCRPLCQQPTCHHHDTFRRLE